MVDNYLYSYNRFNQQLNKTEGFTPQRNNWFISATNGPNGNYYFPNLTSYNHWASTCCGQSYNAIRSGKYNGYDVRFNR